MSNNSSATKYPLLCELLEAHQRPLSATFSIADVAALFTVSPRSIQNRVASGQLQARDLPGRARFLPVDLESYLVASKKKVMRRAA
jgi:hypothetical protein